VMTTENGPVLELIDGLKDHGSEATLWSLPSTTIQTPSLRLVEAVDSEEHWLSLSQLGAVSKSLQLTARNNINA
jgi:hypothetical protein